jgi:hypothetical protein
MFQLSAKPAAFFTKRTAVPFIPPQKAKAQEYGHV